MRNVVVVCCSCMSLQFACSKFQMRPQRSERDALVDRTHQYAQALTRTRIHTHTPQRACVCACLHKRAAKCYRFFGRRRRLQNATFARSSSNAAHSIFHSLGLNNIHTHTLTHIGQPYKPQCLRDCVCACLCECACKQCVHCLCVCVSTCANVYLNMCN